MEDLSPTTCNEDLYLDELPIDIFHFYLFNYLDIDDLFNLKLVSKFFNSVIQSHTITELSFLNRDRYVSYKSNWFSTTKPINFRNILNLSMLHLIRNPPIYIQNLKYLDIQIRRNECLAIKLQDIEKFVRLEILKIEGLSTGDKDTLYLPNLKALSIRVSAYAFDPSMASHIYINSPILNSLHIVDCWFQILCPLTIKYLKIKSYRRSITMFKNLECLEFLNCTNMKALAIDLPQFKVLRKIRIISFPTLTPSLKQTFRSKKKDLALVLGGVNITQANKFNECKGLKRSALVLKFQMNNYAELEDDLNFIRDVEYIHLIRLSSNNLPVNLCKKYNNINRINIGPMIEDENQLIKFISECPNLINFHANKSALSQQFFNQLPAISSLSSLYINNNVSVDCKFIMRMFNLIDFFVNQEFSINENLGYLKFLKFFRFQTNNLWISAVKKEANRYSINVYEKPRCIPVAKVADSFSLDDLIRWYNSLKD